MESVWKSPSFVLRIGIGVWLICGPVWFGSFGNGRWIVFVNCMAAVFTVNFALGRWRSWAHSWRKGLISTTLLGQAKTFFVQWILCAILFWFGRGINRFILVKSKSFDDIRLLLCLWSTVSLLLGVILIFIELRTGAVHGIQSDARLVRSRNQSVSSREIDVER